MMQIKRIIFFWVLLVSFMACGIAQTEAVLEEKKKLLSDAFFSTQERGVQLASLMPEFKALEDLPESELSINDQWELAMILLQIKKEEFLEALQADPAGTFGRMGSSTSHFLSEEGIKHVTQHKERYKLCAAILLSLSIGCLIGSCTECLYGKRDR